MIVSGMLVCNSFLISVCMFIMSKAHIECYRELDHMCSLFSCYFFV